MHKHPFSGVPTICARDRSILSLPSPIISVPSWHLAPAPLSFSASAIMQRALREAGFAAGVILLLRETNYQLHVRSPMGTPWPWEGNMVGPPWAVPRT